MTRVDDALRRLRDAGYLARQNDGYWETEPTYKRAFGERTILNLIRANHAKITATTKDGRPVKIEPTTNGDDNG